MRRGQNQVSIITNQADNYGEIFLYGDIGMYGEITAQAFVKEFKALEKIYGSIHCRVNCVGGSVYDGTAIYNTIKNSSADVYSFIDGIAASMGAVIPQATKHISMSRFARYMTHRAKGGGYGNGDDLRAQADLLDGLDTDLADMISARTGLSVEEVKEKYITTTDRFLTAKQAKAEGIIDDIYDGEPVEIPKTAKTDKDMYAHYHNAITAKLNLNNKKSIIIL